MKHKPTYRNTLRAGFTDVVRTTYPPLGLRTCHQFQRDNYSTHNLPDTINPVRFVTFVVIAQEKVEIIGNIGGDLCFEPFSLTGVAVNYWSPGMDHERYILDLGHDLWGPQKVPR